MIISSYTKLEVGKQYGMGEGEALSDFNSVYHDNIPFVVLRIASREEWINFCNEMNAKIHDLNREFYYQVSMD